MKCLSASRPNYVMKLARFINCAQSHLWLKIHLIVCVKHNS